MTSLIDFKALGEPATKLLEVVAGAIGLLYEPTRIRRKAEAERVASRIQTEAEIERNQLLENAQRRREDAEVRHQRNLETTTKKALGLLPAYVSDEPVANAWVHNWADKAMNVDDDAMQTIWAKLLAGEVAHPGSFSPRTLHLVNMLTKSEAELFTKFCSYCLEMPDGDYHLIAPDPVERFIAARGMGVHEMEVLRGTGLVSHSEMMVNTEMVVLYVKYFGQEFVAERRSDADPFLSEPSIGLTLLTTAGRELYKISGAQPVDGFIEALTSPKQNQQFAFRKA